MCSSKGASIQPVRPDYPPAAEVLKEFVVSSIKVPLFLTVLTYLLQPYWLMFVQCLHEMGGNDAGIFAVSVVATHAVTYCIWNGFFYVLDTYEYLQQYRMHRTPAMQHTPEQYKHTLVVAFVGQVIIAPFMLYNLYDIFLRDLFQQPSEEITDFQTTFLSFMAAKTLNSVLFYWAHRTAHHPALYWIHKQHHSYVGCISVSAEYAHPLEQVFTNQMPIVLSIMLTVNHPLPTMFWVWERLQQTYQTHSGYAFVGTLPHKLGITHTSGAAFHDFHHSVNSGNYSEPWTDYVFGTMDPWLAQGGEEGYLARKDKSEN
eukprot:TRINITY_DN3_c0_g3_i2.p1 TRINITY_DN3_c0_g3~~TRINITY_DN3_c0_g3_i2.p1  ORF type:complete len:343 (+),score=90.12 TRINITY_DN3_c0_g3_i2:85-1029(+)